MKGHDKENYGNERADALADTGREQNILVALDDEEWLDRHPALQDGVTIHDPRTDLCSPLTPNP